MEGALGLGTLVTGMYNDREPVIAPTGAIKLSRYVLLDRLASGGAGVVYTAYDPELDRRVAVKLLLPLESKSGDDTSAAVRLMREAQATARLSHPNVVSIYDVGTYDLEDGELARLTRDLENLDAAERIPQRRGVFVVMELVPGKNLRDWIRAGGHDAHEILDVFASAGEGLAAAHAEELVHRDFKPANVIVGPDGRARVLDFGLARLVSNQPEVETTTGGPPVAADDPTMPADAADEKPAVALSDMEATVEYPTDAVMVPGSEGMVEVKILQSRLTRTGTVMGTPAYMSPEQHRAESTDERTDQFSYCVALYEALFAARPYPGDTLDELAKQKDAGPPEPSGGQAVPAHVRRAVFRGLSPKVGDRFGSMRELLDELAFDPSARRRRWGLIGALVVAMGGSVFGLQTWQSQRSQSCESHANAFDEVWGQQAKAAVAAAFAAVDRPYAKDAWVSVERGLDDYTGQWVEQRKGVCVESVVRSELAPDAAGRRLRCLSQRRDALDELLVVLRGVDEEVAAHAIEAVDALPSLDACADDEGLLLGALPPDPGELEAVQATEAHLAGARVLRSAGKYSSALESAQKAVETSESLAHASTKARALLELAAARSSLAEYEAAEAAAREALLVAEAGGADDESTDARVRLVELVGYRLARHDEARRLADVTAARLRHRAVDDQIGRHAYNFGLLSYAQAKHDEAAEHLQGAVEFYTEYAGADSLEITRAYNILGASRLRAGDLAQARAALEKAVELRRAKLGAYHPQVAQPLNNLALVVLQEGEPEEALKLFEETLKIRSSAFDEDHELVSASLMNIGITLMDMGKYEEALPKIKRSTEITEKTYGHDHPIVADGLGNLGQLLNHLGRHEDALAHHREALAIRERVLAKGHDSLGTAHYELGESLMLTERPAEALAAYEAAERLIRQNRGDDAESLAGPVRGVGLAMLALGERETAVPQFERALKLDPIEGEATVSQGRALFGLARALEKKDPKRALELAKEAEAAFEGTHSKTVDGEAPARWVRGHGD